MSFKNNAILMKVGTLSIYAYEVKICNKRIKDIKEVRVGDRIEFISYFSDERWQTGIVREIKDIWSSGIVLFVERF